MLFSIEYKEGDTIAPAYPCKKSVPLSCSFLYLISMAFALAMMICAMPLSLQALTACPLAEEIESLFPVMEGYIVEVKGDQVFIDLHAGSGIKKGMEFLCIREGEEFTHPITGAVLGRFEDRLGIIQVADIKESYSIGSIVQAFSEKPVKRGDKVRITAARISVALPPDAYSDPAMESLAGALVDGGRFSLVPKGSLAAFLEQKGWPGIEGLSPGQITEMCDRVDISVFLIPALMQQGERPVIQTRVISGRTGREIAQVTNECSKGSMTASKQTSLQATGVEAPVLLEGAQRFLATPQNGITSYARLSREIPMAVRFMALGDVTGDGRTEICVSDGRDISLFSWNGEALSTLAQISGSASEGHVALDIADINKNGKAEVFISSFDNGYLKSFVLEWDGSGLNKIWKDVPLFLRVMPVYPSQKILLGQAAGITEPFDSRINEYVWENGGFARYKKIDLPAHVNIFNVAMADLDGDGKEELAFMDRGLEIFRGGKKIWKSEAEYGGTTFFFEHAAKGTLAFKEEKERVYLSSHFSIQDINGNGRPDIMLLKPVSSTGTLFPQSRLYRKGEACLLEWDGISFSEVWRSGEIDAYLTDIGIGDIKADRKSGLVIAMILAKGIGKFWEAEPSKLLFY